MLRLRLWFEMVGFEKFNCMVFCSDFIFFRYFKDKDLEAIK